MDFESDLQRCKFAISGVEEHPRFKGCVRQILTLLERGRINGCTYFDDINSERCECFIGSLARIKSIPVDSVIDEFPNLTYVEDLFWPIEPGQTPSNTYEALIAKIVITSALEMSCLEVT